MEYDRKNAPDSLAGAFTIALGRHGGLSIYEFDRDIEIDQGKAYSLANQYLMQNMDDASISNVQVEDSRITVNAEATTPLFFMAMFGQNEFTVEAMASASLDDSNKGTLVQSVKET